MSIFGTASGHSEGPFSLNVKKFDKSLEMGSQGPGRLFSGDSSGIPGPKGPGDDSKGRAGSQTMGLVFSFKFLFLGRGPSRS